MYDYNFLDTPPFVFIRCRIGGRDYAIETSWVLDIKKADRLEVDLQPNGRVGWISSMGQNLEVFDLARRFKHKRPQFNPQQDRIILINASPVFGILVEGVSQATQVPSHNVHGFPNIVKSSDQNFFEGIILTIDTMLLLLAPADLFPQFTSNTPDHHQNLTAATYYKLDQDWLSVINPGNTPALVHFRLAEDEKDGFPLFYGLSSSQVLEIMPPANILPIPGAPKYILGFTRWHQIPVPLIDLGRLLGRSSDLTLSSQKSYQFVMVRDPDGQLACICAQDEVDIKQTPFSSRPSKLDLPYDHPALMGLFELPQANLVLLNTTDLLSVS